MGKPDTRARRIRSRVSWIANIFAVVLMIGLAWHLNGLQSDYTAKQAETEFWRELIQSTHTGLVVVDPDDLTIVEWSDGAEYMLGWPAEDVVGAQLFFLMGDRYAQVHELLVRDPTMPGRLVGQKRVIDCWVNTKDGTRQNIRLEVSAVRIGGKIHYTAMFDLLEHVKDFPPLPKPTEPVDKIDFPREQQRYLPELDR